MKYDVAIIGGGPAGYTAAERAAKGGLSTILFEKNALGGVCLNEGCVPTKTLLYSAKTYDNIRHASKYAVKAENPSFDLGKIIARKNKVVKIDTQPSQETPKYMRMARQLLTRYEGMTVTKAAKAEIDGVTGATYTSEALKKNVKAGLEYYKKHGK